MHSVSIAPELDVEPDRLSGRTPWVARAVWLLSYDRHVTVDRSRRQVSVVTRRFWLWRRKTVIAFERIDRIILRAQQMPGFGLWGFLTLGMSLSASSAFVLVALGLAGGRDEFVLFTIWESESNDPAWLDELTATPAGRGGDGDDGATRVVGLLQQYLGVPVSSH